MFELTGNTTFDQYAYAVKSNRVHLLKLLPAEYPFFRLWFHFDSFQCKLHRDFPGVGAWRAELDYEFQAEAETMVAVADKKQKGYILVPLLWQRSLST